MPDNFSLSPLLLFHTISHFLCCPFFAGNVSYNCHFCQSVEEIPALNPTTGKTFFGILVLVSLAYKYGRIIRVHLRNIP